MACIVGIDVPRKKRSPGKPMADVLITVRIQGTEKEDTFSIKNPLSFTAGGLAVGFDEEKERRLRQKYLGREEFLEVSEISSGKYRFTKASIEKIREAIGTSGDRGSSVWMPPDSSDGRTGWKAPVRHDRATNETAA